MVISHNYQVWGKQLVPGNYDPINLNAAISGNYIMETFFFEVLALSFFIL